jgi:AcrR family transcriptional regulator
VATIPAAKKAAEAARLERKAARQGRRKDEILRAALHIAESAGPEGFTADDVARALAMSTPSVFYYFPGGLAELRAAVALRRFYGRLDVVLKKIEQAPSGVAALTTWVRGMAKAYEEDVDGFGKDLEIMQRGSWGADLVAMHIEKLNALFGVVEKKLEQDRVAGRLHPKVENLRRLAMLMNQLGLGLIVGDQLRRKVGGGSKHALEGLVDDLCGLIERGIAKR